MRLSSQMHDGIDPMLMQQFTHQRAIADATLNKHMSRIILKIRKASAVSRIGELVEIDHFLDDHAHLAGAFPKQVSDKI